MSADKLTEALREIKAYAGNPELVWAKATAALAMHAADKQEPDKLDAERYRLLRRGQHWSVISGIGDTLRGEELDSAIDAAKEAK